MDFSAKALQDYVDDHSTPESDLLQKVNRETHLHVLKPRMISGRLQGRVLSMLSHMIEPNYILEIGTYTGYSALSMAEGLTENGKLITIEINEELEARIQSYLNESPLGHKVQLKIGDAKNIIPTLNFEWDIVFIDANKDAYPDYYELTFNQLRSGGFMLIDNVLWSGKVLDSNINDKATVSVREFNEKIQNDKRVQNVLFPIRDGLMVLRKI